jgi:TPR repeat protein
MKRMHWPVVVAALAVWMWPAAVRADALDRLNADTAAERSAMAGDAAPWVHCLLPGQVRRLGMSTTVTPRRAVRVSAQQCQEGGGEYVQAQDSGGALKIWLPMAAEGLADAQVMAGELYEQQGNRAMAKAWYEKAAAQGLPRAQADLANVLSQGNGGAADQARVVDLVRAAGGGLAAGLLVQTRESLRIDVVSPDGATQLPRSADGRMTVAVQAGPQTVMAKVVAPSGLASLRANGQAVAPDEQGLLSVPVVVAEQGASVLIEAADRDGAMARAEVALTQRSAMPAASSLPAPAGVALPEAQDLAAFKVGRRWALVVANQAYQHWSKLDTPLADAQAVSEVLHDRFGYETRVLRDATRAQLLAALSDLRAKAGPQDQVVVYYAGHGQMDPVTARGYWIPVDGDTKDIAQWVSVIDVTDQLAAMQARHILVIADSCYSGTLTRSLLPRVDQSLTASQRRAPLLHLAQQRVRVALTSGGLEPVLDGGSVSHSLFARSLLDVLAEVRGPVVAEELHHALAARFSYLGRRLKVSQQPLFAPIGFAGHEAGDFVLSPM